MRNKSSASSKQPLKQQNAPPDQVKRDLDQHEDNVEHDTVSDRDEPRDRPSGGG